MFNHHLIVIAVCACLSAGCASQILSDERIRTNTAGVLGESAESVSISNRREQTPNTYYTATIKSGAEYDCLINGGNVMTLGMVNPPLCNKKGEPPKSFNLFAR